MAIDIQRRGGDAVAVRILRDAVGFSVNSNRKLLIIELSVDDMDLMTAESRTAILEAAERAGLTPYYSYKIAQQLAPEAPAWRDRLAELTDWGEADAGTGDWALINERVGELRALYNRASTPDDRGDVGRRCRQLIISAVNVVFRPTMVPDGDEVPQEANAKERFKYVLNYYGRGSLDEKLKALLDRAWDLATGTLHHDSAGRAATFAVAQATILAIRTLGVIKSDLEDQGR